VTAWPEFGQPAWLVLLLAVPPLIVWWWRRPVASLRYSTVGLAAAVNSRRGKVARWCGALGRGLGLAGVVIALAGPRWPDPGSRIPTEGIAVLLIVDVSNSMNEDDFIWDAKPTTRLVAVKKAFRLFIAGGSGPQGEQLPSRSNDLFGLVTFTRRPKSSCPLTLSHDTLLQMLDREEAGKGGHDVDTNIGDAIAWSVHRLNASPFKQKVMVLVTDGEQGEIPGALRPRQAAQLAAHFGMPIFIVDAGNDAVTMGKEPAKELAAESRLNAKKTMQEVAKMTSGQYYAAPDGKSLVDACVKLGLELDRIEREQIETFQYRKYWEGFAWFGGAAFVLWMALLGLELTVWRRLP
jgi:Ca-activated chloride channel family protein